MEFTGAPIIKDIDVLAFTVEGLEFFQETINVQPGFLAKTEFLVKMQTIDLHVTCPTEPNLEYQKKYGPYSIEILSKKIDAIYTSFHMSEKIRNPKRLFKRKMWVFKQLFELFDESFDLLLVRMSKMIPSIYCKAINILEQAESRIWNDNYDKQTIKYACLSMEIIRKVYHRIVDILKEEKFLKLLSYDLLEHFVTHASPCMVSKIRCLRWIEPEVAICVEPKYNSYWASFWHPFLKRNFKFSSELCFIIAEYMPIKISAETFLDYFRRRYNANKGYFIGRAFEIEKTHVFRNGEYLNKITIVFP